MDKNIQTGSPVIDLCSGTAGQHRGILAFNYYMKLAWDLLLYLVH